MALRLLPEVSVVPAEKSALARKLQKRLEREAETLGHFVGDARSDGDMRRAFQCVDCGGRVLIDTSGDKQSSTKRS